MALWIDHCRFTIDDGADGGDCPSGRPATIMSVISVVVARRDSRCGGSRMSKTAESPRIVIIAGPNGAGKTTFAQEFLPRLIDKGSNK
jgi:putative protein kinase ArgK-like GTPase of G3E family